MSKKPFSIRNSISHNKISPKFTKQITIFLHSLLFLIFLELNYVSGKETNQLLKLLQNRYSQISDFSCDVRIEHSQISKNDNLPLLLELTYYFKSSTPVKNGILTNIGITDKIKKQTNSPVNITTIYRNQKIITKTQDNKVSVQNYNLNEYWGMSLYDLLQLNTGFDINYITSSFNISVITISGDIQTSPQEISSSTVEGLTEGTTTYCLRLIPKNRNTNFHYTSIELMIDINKMAITEVKLKFNGDTFRLIGKVTEWKIIDNVWVPAKCEYYAGNTKYEIKTITNTRINTGIPDAIFEMDK